MRARKRCGISATVGLKWFNHQSIVRFFWFKAYLLIYYYLLISNSLQSYYVHTHVHIYIYTFIYVLIFFYLSIYLSIYLYYLRKIDMHIQVSEILLYNHKLPINC